MNKLTVIVLAMGLASLNGFAGGVSSQQTKSIAQGQSKQVLTQQSASKQQAPYSQQSSSKQAAQSSGQQQAAQASSCDQEDDYAYYDSSYPDPNYYDNSVSCSDWIGVNADFFWRCVGDGF